MVAVAIVFEFGEDNTHRTFANISHITPPPTGTRPSTRERTKLVYTGKRGSLLIISCPTHVIAFP